MAALDGIDDPADQQLLVLRPVRRLPDTILWRAFSGGSGPRTTHASRRKGRQDDPEVPGGPCDFSFLERSLCRTAFQQVVRYSYLLARVRTPYR